MYISFREKHMYSVRCVNIIGLTLRFQLLRELWYTWYFITFSQTSKSHRFPSVKEITSHFYLFTFKVDTHTHPPPQSPLPLTETNGIPISWFISQMPKIARARTSQSGAGNPIQISYIGGRKQVLESYWLPSRGCISKKLQLGTELAPKPRHSVT